MLDTANPDPTLIHAVVRLSDRVPSLKIVIDHLPELTPPGDAAARRLRSGSELLGSDLRCLLKFLASCEMLVAAFRPISISIEIGWIISGRPLVRSAALRERLAKLRSVGKVFRRFSAG